MRHPKHKQTTARKLVPIRTSSMQVIRNTIITALVLATTMAPAADQSVLDAQKRRVEVVEKAAPSVVAIFAAGGKGGGSGVLISPDGYALTNFHVTRGAGTFMKCGLNDGLLYDAVIVGIDPTGDVALIKMLGRDDFPHAPLGDSDKLKAGDWAFAMGNPFLLATNFRPTVTYGIVSGVHRYQYPAGTFLEYADCIQIDTSINPGNSGGPLFNDDGELVGINGRGSFEKRGRVNSGAGYAISINQIKYFMDHLRSGRVVDHATLGATVATRDDGSVVVGNILDESEAYRRGLRIDDEIVTFGGRSIRSVNQFKNVLGVYPKGWKLPLVYRADGKRQTTYVRLRALHRASELTPKKKKKKPPVRPKGKPGKKPVPGKKPIPIPHPGGAPAAQAPAKYKHMFVKKEGYTNYYFNTLERSRTLKGMAALGDFSKATGIWKLAGKTKAGDNYQFTLSADEATLALGQAGRHSQPFDGSDLQDEPRGTGGLLVAMHHLRLLATNPKRKFTEFFYLGSEPLDGRGEQVDVIIATLNEGRSRLYFSKQTGALVGLDTALGDDVDACELRFSNLKDFGGRKLPSSIVVRRSGAEDFATFQIEKAELSPAGE
jgi:serine protease Do